MGVHLEKTALDANAAIVIKAGVHQQEVTLTQPANGKNFTLKEAQKIVGGLIELVHISENRKVIMVVNEEGKLNGSSVNIIATEIYQRTTGIKDDAVFGDVIVCPSSFIK